MNNEPVAWMELYFGEPNNLAWDNTELRDSGDVYKTIPLYTHPASLVDWSYQQGYQIGKETHPAKTLTDEEIKQVWQENLVTMGNDLDFARAILRKAQKK